MAGRHVRSRHSVMRPLRALAAVACLGLPALAAPPGPPPMQKVVTKSATFVLYAPKGWEVVEAQQPGFRTVAVSAPGGRVEAALFHGTSPTGGDVAALTRRFTGGIASRFHDFVITASR